jgi:hypothetical protein
VRRAGLAEHPARAVDVHAPRDDQQVVDVLPAREHAGQLPDDDPHPSVRRGREGRAVDGVEAVQEPDDDRERRGGAGDLESASWVRPRDVRLVGAQQRASPYLVDESTFEHGEGEP